MDHQQTPGCPFCDFTDPDAYFLTLHVETVHPESGVSPFAVRERYDHNSNTRSVNEAATIPSSSHAPAGKVDGHDYVNCPHGCGEQIPTEELMVHTDLHMAEAMAFEDFGLATPMDTSSEYSGDDQTSKSISNQFSHDIPAILRTSDQLDGASVSSRESRRSRQSLKDLFLGTARSPTQQKKPLAHSQVVSKGKIKRLGRSELGPYAHERQMPKWLMDLLEEGSKVTAMNRIKRDGTLARVETVPNETQDLVPTLAKLSELDPSVRRAFYCRPEVRHVAKLPKEGGFCGYRNIQMMISHIRAAKVNGHEQFPDKTPSILQLQEMIEQAWDMGFNSNARIETGGVRGTRKYIGTPEAQALFNSLGIGCEAATYTRTRETDAHETLLIAVGDYFGQDRTVNNAKEKVALTSMPPLYFQHHGHSMTIIGIELRTSGTLNLVVFDPMFRPSQAMIELLHSGSFKRANTDKLMKLHRRGEGYLCKYTEFEILKLS